MLTATFVRHPGRRDRVYVRRSDGSTTGWDFPSYGDGLPHDLCHLVVEQELGISDGFWSLLDAGADVELIDNQSTLVRGGLPLTEHPGFALDGLRKAEVAVAQLTGTSAEPGSVGGGAAVQRAKRRLSELAARWRQLEDGKGIEEAFFRH